LFGWVFSEYSKSTFCNSSNNSSFVLFLNHLTISGFAEFFGISNHSISEEKNNHVHQTKTGIFFLE